MIQLTCLETKKEENFEHYGCFNIEPLEIGQGITLGNSLRRTLLSDLYGCAITNAHFEMETTGFLSHLNQENKIRHEFQPINGIREDSLEILLNLKEILFKLPIRSEIFSKNFEPIIGIIESTGPKIITASQISFPFLLNSEKPQILNLHHYICTMTTNDPNKKFRIKLKLDIGKGYKISESPSIPSIDGIERDNYLFPFQVDAFFMPVKRVNFRIKMIHDSFGNLKESLFLEVITNGSLTPHRALQESLKLLLDLLVPLFTQEVLSSMTETLKISKSISFKSRK